MRRPDKRTLTQIAIEDLRHKLRLKDAELCKGDLRCAWLSLSQRGRCTASWITDGGSVVDCPAEGRWGVYIPGVGARRRCDEHAAQAVRARLTLLKLRYERGLIH